MYSVHSELYRALEQFDLKKNKVKFSIKNAKHLDPAGLKDFQVLFHCEQSQLLTILFIRREKNIYILYVEKS